MNQLAIEPLATPPARSVTDQVFSVLYDAVIKLKLPPGTKVTENEIARHLDVSRQPVRDALFRLSKLGFLDMRPQRATVITLISEQAVMDALFTRTALEVECLRVTMTRMSRIAKQQLRDNLAQQKASVNAYDPAEFHTLDEAFHEAICSIAGHAHVWQLIREQKAHMDRIRYLTLSRERRRQVLTEHLALLKAIEAGSTAQAEALLRAHLLDIRTVLKQAQNNHPEYFEKAELTHTRAQGTFTM